MSALENEAKPLLEPMMDGESLTLDLPAQATVATWAVKTAMVLEAIDATNLRGYTLPECERLRSLSAIPYRTSVWLSQSVDPACLFSSKTRHRESEIVDTITGISTTIGFAHFVVQVFTIRVPDSIQPTDGVTARARTGPWHEATLRIWPTQPVTLSWPPIMGLRGEPGLDALADRFSAAGVDGVSAVALAV